MPVAWIITSYVNENQNKTKVRFFFPDSVIYFVMWVALKSSYKICEVVIPFLDI